MNRKTMMKKVQAGAKPIDVAIEKWEDILARTGYDLGSKNCALCYVYDCFQCPIHIPHPLNGSGGCGGFHYVYDMTWEEKQCMLQFLYATKDELVRQGKY